ncbi:YfbM family protein, partial [Escherichia coli]|nr:YfbM family protein [Escherichia coli]
WWVTTKRIGKSILEKTLTRWPVFVDHFNRSELRKQFSIKRLNEMEIYPGVTFSEELEGQLFASIMLDMEKLISAYRRMLRQGNHALTVIVG